MNLSIKLNLVLDLVLFLGLSVLCYCGSISLIYRFLLYVQFRKDVRKDVFIIEDWKSEKYVAMTENANMSLTATMAEDISTSERKMVQVTVTSVLNPRPM